MVNSEAQDDTDDDSTGPYSKEAVREAMQFDRGRIRTEPSAEPTESDDDEAESDEWECAKCGHGRKAYGMDALNEVYETPGGEEIHYGCRRNG